ncbi:MFS transporter [Spirochaetia bacterium]|nr:MFS transporter [Spirochaetia bacterium]
MINERSGGNARIWTREFLSIFLANLLLYLGQFMVQPLITTYAAELGAEAATLGFVAGAFAVTAIIFKVFSGPAIDCLNRKYVLAGAIIILSVAFFGYSISTNVTLVIIFRFLQGAGQAFTATCCLALAADALPQEKISSGLGVFALAQVAAQAVSPAIGLFIGEHFGFRVSFITGGIVLLTSVLLALQIRTKPPAVKKQFKISFSNTISIPSLLPAFLLLLNLCCFCLINSYLVLYALELNIANIGSFFTIYAVALIISRPLLGKWSDKYGFIAVTIPGLIVYAFSFFVISYAHTLPMFFLAAFLSAVGSGASQPMMNSLCMKTVPQDRRGAASSTAYIGMDIGNIIGPIIAGIVASRYGYSFMWRIMTVFLFISVVVILIFRKKIMQIENVFGGKS